MPGRGLRHIDQPQHFFQPCCMLGRAAEEQLFAGCALGDLQRAVGRAERLGRDAEHLANRRHRGVERQVLELELAQPGVGKFGLLDRVDDRANRPQPAGRFGHLNLPGLRQRDHLALRAQQRLNFLGGLLRRHVPHRKQHANQLVLAALVELRQRHVGHQVRRDAVFQIHDHQHPIAADQRVALGQQHAVEHVERFGRRVAPRIAVVERAGRRRFHRAATGRLGRRTNPARPATAGSGN